MGQKRAEWTRTMLDSVELCFNNNGDDKSLRRTDWMGDCGYRGAMVAAMLINECGGGPGRAAEEVHGAGVVDVVLLWR